MPTLSPQAYCYLRHPILSSGETMLYHTFQHLCFTGALKVHYEDVMVGRSRPRMMTRLFLSRGIAPAADASAQTFAWNLIPPDRAIMLVDLRRVIEEEIEDHERFKYEYLYKDLKAGGFLHTRHFRSKLGREACRRTRDLLFTVEKDIGGKLPGGWERSLQHVQDLWSCVVVLDDDTREELKAAPLVARIWQQSSRSCATSNSRLAVPRMVAHSWVALVEPVVMVVVVVDSGASAGAALVEEAVAAVGDEPPTSQPT